MYMYIYTHMFRVCGLGFRGWDLESKLLNGGCIGDYKELR